ncbi:MAG: 50S ribosomal protein L5 [Candidatus Micrarchaeaceae archaeon]|jgi:large subunit ribosomal protein L5|nr:50S ribosomal protein L5 [Candidatus Micrarchaeota archaeon]HII10396.1 50S ribosomal protein L5 [Candidatus Micrarchaeota archaeon]
MEGANSMRNLRINKLVINIGTGSDENLQGNAKRLIETITGRKSADEISRTRNPSFKIAKGQKIGAFVTVRGDAAKKLVTRLFEAVDNKIKERAITSNSLSFGIPEYIDISGVKYDPKVGMLGMNVNLSFRRSGLRVALRKRQNAKVPAKHREVSKEEIIDYIKKEFNVSAVEEAS